MVICKAVMDLCRTFEDVCLTKGDPTAKLALAKNLQQFRGQIQKEQTANGKQMTLADAWGKSPSVNLPVSTVQLLKKNCFLEVKYKKKVWSVFFVTAGIHWTVKQIIKEILGNKNIKLLYNQNEMEDFLQVKRKKIDLKKKKETDKIHIC